MCSALIQQGVMVDARDKEGSGDDLCFLDHMSSPVTVGQLCSVHHMEGLLTQCPYYWKLRLTLIYRTMRYIVYLLVYTLYCYTLY